MKNEPSIDCMKIKSEIQRRILAEFAGMPADEVRRVQREQIERDPQLGPFLARVRDVNISTSNST